MIALLALLASLAAEALAIYLVAELVAGAYADRGAVSAPMFVTLMFLAYGVIRGVDWYGVGTGPAYTAIALATFALLYGSIRLEFAGDIAVWDFGWTVDFVQRADTAGTTAVVIGSILMMLTWARGAYRGTTDLELETIPRQLAVPFGVAITVCVFAAWSDRLDIIGRATAAFFVFAVAALALSQSALSGATIGSVRSSGVTGALLGLTAIGTLVSVVIFGLVFGLLGGLLGSYLVSAVQFILILVLTPVLLAFDAILGWLVALFDPSFSSSGEGAGPAEPAPGEDGLGGFAATGLRIALLLVGTLVIIGALALVSRLYRRSRQARQAPPGSSAAGSFGEDLRSLFHNPFRRRSGPPEGDDAIALYRRVLHDAEGRGRPRPPSQTPGEYAPALQDLFHTRVTDEITAAFVEARYAGRAPDPDRIRELQRQWEESRS